LAFKNRCSFQHTIAMRFSLFLAIVATIVTSKQLEKQQDGERRELFVVTLTIACVAAVVGAVATGVTNAALNNNGQQQAPLNNNVNVHVHIYQQANGQWVERPQGPSRRLLAVDAASVNTATNSGSGGTSGSGSGTETDTLPMTDRQYSRQTCPAGTLKLPVGEYGKGWRIIDKFANVNPSACKWWESAQAKKARVVGLAPPGCFQYMKSMKDKIKEATMETARDTGSSTVQQVPATGATSNGVRVQEVGVSQTALFSSWMPISVIFFGAVLILVSVAGCFRKKTNEAKVYFRLEEEALDEF